MNFSYLIIFFITIFLILQFFIFPVTQITTQYNNNLNDNNVDNNSSLKVVGIQADLNQRWNQRIENRKINLNKYLELSNRAIKKYNPQVVVWQEYLFTHPFEFDVNMQNKLHKFTIENNITLIVGSITLKDKKNMNGKRYNTLYIFENGKMKTYNAYEPFPLFDNDYVKEKHNLPITILNKFIGFAICYEESFSYVFTKQIKENNAELFFAVGNQYVMTNYNALKLTSLSSNLRAVENNRYIFRLETSGLSTVIDNSGNNIKEVPINSEQILFYEIPLINTKTFYSNYRIFIEILFVFFSIFILLFIGFFRKNN